MEVSAQKGLRAIPEWANSDHSRMPVYSKQAADLQDCDRPALMRFVAEAGKYGFEFQKESGEFLLSDWSSSNEAFNLSSKRVTTSCLISFIDSINSSNL